jgi:hypothetical protein
MLRKFTFPALLTICSFVVGKFSFATTYVNNGTNTNYTLNAGDSLYIASGTYTGTISGLNSVSTKITVSDMAIFQPAGFPNNAVCTMNVYGTAIFNYNIRTNTNFVLNNYGVFSVNGTTVMNGSNQEWINNYGAVLNLNGAVTVNSGTDANSFINYGTINCSSTLTMTAGAQFTNYKNLIVGGEFTVNGGTLENRGKLQTTGLLNFNNGAAIIRNYCGMSSLGGIRNTSLNFYNYSYLWARNDNGLGNITNSGTIYNQSWSYDNQSIPMIHGKNYTQTNGSITGNGYLYFYGTTTQLGGTTGAAGVTTDTLKMYDITRSNFSVFYDPAQAGTVYPNAIYNAWGVPDSLRAYFVGCSAEVLLEVPLAINWNFFEVNLTNNIPLLNWSAEFVQGTVFEIQRSYDGRNFSTIHDLPYEVGQSAYEYKDRMVNTQAPIVYYRVRSVEISGVEKYTQTRIVKFNNKPGSIYAAPNPFTNNFIINYRSAERETITIRIFNVSGQQRLTKNVIVNDGNNNINITEAAQLAKGIYVVQVSKGSNLISSGKIIKQ